MRKNKEKKKRFKNQEGIKRGTDRLTAAAVGGGKEEGRRREERWRRREGPRLDGIHAWAVRA